MSFIVLAKFDMHHQDKKSRLTTPISIKQYNNFCLENCLVDPTSKKLLGYIRLETISYNPAKAEVNTTLRRQDLNIYGGTDVKSRI